MATTELCLKQRISKVQYVPLGWYEGRGLKFKVPNREDSLWIFHCVLETG